MLIILEGPDGAGKTTFAQRIVTHLAATFTRGTITMKKAGPPTRSPRSEYIVPLLDYIPGDDHHVICDRWHLGEWIYPRVKGRPTEMDRDTFDEIEQFLLSRGAVTVIINPPVETLQRRVFTRGDDYVRVGELPMLHEAYSIAQIPQMPTLRYSLTEPGDELARIVVNAARHAAMRATLLRTGDDQLSWRL